MIEVLYEIFSSIRSHKWHVIVTGFAMLWSVFLLIFLLGSGNGVIHAVKNSMGIDTLSIFSIRPGVAQLAYEGYESKREIKLYFSDLENLKSHLGASAKSIEATVIGPNVDIVHQNRHINMPISGITQNFLITHNCRIWNGANISELNELNHEHVCLINFHTAETLFPCNTDPVNQTIMVNEIPFRIIGIYGFAFDAPIRNILYIPMSVARDLFNKDDRVSLMYVLSSKSLHNEVESDNFAKSIYMWFSRTHRFSPNDHAAMTCKNMSIHAMRLQYGMSLLKIFVWCISMAALLVGISSISNIMLIMVNDRTREFGVRKILGASNLNIVLQVLSESIIITTVFGYIGIILAIILLSALSWFFTDILNLHYFTHPNVDTLSILITLIILVISGLAAGIYPAIKTIRMKPIESLYA